ncbi:MAG TPA: signal peptidase II [Candidatus Woesebacteria bacterium]|nr:signal peptidase II [Candidatus Woesebacteria bacterium]
MIQIIMVIGLIWWWLKTKKSGLLLIILGGLLNIFDRMYFGYVRDYWKIPFTNIYNNINDWLIFIGAILTWKQFRK